MNLDLWSNPIIAVDAKEFALIKRFLKCCQIKCLKLDKMTASLCFPEYFCSSEVEVLQENGSVSFVAILYG